MEYQFKAKQYGNSVESFVDADDIKQALAEAKIEARRIFDYKDGDEMPTVSVKEVKEKEEVQKQ